ncbi:MAG: NADH-quinone oxidoreductase subunit J [SAR202 cluster bacterium]|nr:NADH-quinone oxidoreductase subunit J [SAR202 cluster bacterium]
MQPVDNAFQEFLFWLLAAVTVGCAVLVVVVRDMFRAALLLIASLMSVAGIFVLLNAEFLAVVQVAIYAGAIAILVVFAVMLTRDVPEANRSSPIAPAAFTMAAVLLGALIYSIMQAEWDLLPEDVPAPLAAVFVDTPARLGTMLLNEYVLAFEIAGVLLFAAVIGALALVRER